MFIQLHRIRPINSTKATKQTSADYPLLEEFDLIGTKKFVFSIYAMIFSLMTFKISVHATWPVYACSQIFIPEVIVNSALTSILLIDTDDSYASSFHCFHFHFHFFEWEGKRVKPSVLVIIAWLRSKLFWVDS